MSDLPPHIEAQLNAPPKKSSALKWIIVALCLGSVLCVGLVAAVLTPVFAQAKEMAILTSCGENMRKVGICLSRYAKQNGSFPAHMHEARYYAGDNAGDIRCTKEEMLKFGFGYDYNAAVYAGKRPEDISPETFEKEPMLIEAYDAREDDFLTPDSKFGDRHMLGRYVNAYYYNKGAVKIKLTDAQMSSHIRDVLYDLKPIPYRSE